jgi:hypothetical protein
MQPVLKALHGVGIHVVALHHPMTMASPCVVCLHSRGIGSTRTTHNRIIGLLAFPLLQPTGVFGK